MYKRNYIFLLIWEDYSVTNLKYVNSTVKISNFNCYYVDIYNVYRPFMYMILISCMVAYFILYIVMITSIKFSQIYIWILQFNRNSVLHARKCNWIGIPRVKFVYREYKLPVLCTEVVVIFHTRELIRFTVSRASLL